MLFFSESKGACCKTTGVEPPWAPLAVIWAPVVNWIQLKQKDSSLAQSKAFVPTHSISHKQADWPNEEIPGSGTQPHNPPKSGCSAAWCPAGGGRRRPAGEAGWCTASEESGTTAEAGSEPPARAPTPTEPPGTQPVSCTTNDASTF